MIKTVLLDFSFISGGRILGKAVCEDLCCSASSFTSASGPVKNPYDPTRSTGGSSSGSASLVIKINEISFIILMIDKLNTYIVIKRLIRQVMIM